MPSTFDPDDLSPAERRSWDKFVAHVRGEVVDMVDSASFFMSLVPDGEVDVKFAVELGLGIMYDKPIVAVAMNGVKVPPGLRRVAHAVIEIDDVDTEAGRVEFVRQLQAITDELGIDLHSS